MKIVSDISCSDEESCGVNVYWWQEQPHPLVVSDTQPLCQTPTCGVRHSRHPESVSDTLDISIFYSYRNSVRHSRHPVTLWQFETVDTHSVTVSDTLWQCQTTCDSVSHPVTGSDTLWQCQKPCDNVSHSVTVYQRDTNIVECVCPVSTDGSHCHTLWQCQTPCDSVTA